MHKNILSAREKCLDCHHFVKDVFNKQFRCRFGLIPMAMEAHGNALDIYCNCYVDFKGKEAPAWKFHLKIKKEK